MIFGNGTKVEYVYDELDRVSEVWYTENGTNTLSFTYNADDIRTGKTIEQLGNQ